MKTIQDIAKHYLTFFTQSTRDNGNTFYHTKDDSPEELDELIKQAHGGMFPDDLKYEMIKDALEAISDSEEGEESEAIYNIEPDHRNSVLLQWFSSSMDRVGYVDEAISELGHGDNIMNSIQAGMKREIDEISNSVLNSLQSIIEDIAA